MSLKIICFLEWADQCNGKELSIIEKNKIEKEFNSTMNTLGYL